MKILTWNCCGAFRKKFEYLKTFEADITVIQECENPKTTKDKKYTQWAKNYLWTGERSHKGLGIFAAEHILIKDLDWRTDGLRYFITCRINNEFNLLGVWCHVPHPRTFPYIGQLWKYLQDHKNRLGRSIIVGDFNSHAMWDKPGRCWNHSDVVRELKELEIESVYHQYFQQYPHGIESHPTFYLQRNLRKAYHIDYIFATTDFRKSTKAMRLGNSDEWLQISDHMPVFWEF